MLDEDNCVWYTACLTPVGVCSLCFPACYFM